MQGYEKKKCKKSSKAHKKLPSRAKVDWGLMTNRGAAHFRSIKTSCIRYFSVCNFLKDENSLNLPRGSTNSFQLAYFCLIFSRIAKNLFRAISRVLWLWSPVSHWCCKHSWAFKRFSLVLIKSLRIKSLPSSLTLTKASSSNCQLENRKKNVLILFS